MRCEAQLRDIARGDKAAFNAFYREWSRPMNCYATGLLAGDRSTAEDILNEAFFAIWEQAGSFSGSGSAEGWVRRIVRNKAIDWVRKQRETSMTSTLESQIANETADSSFDPYENAAKSSATVQLHNALSLLSVEHREAIWLCYFEERPLAEISKLIGCPENTVKTRLFYARKILAQLGVTNYSAAL